MSPSVRKTFLALGAFCALAVGGAALAGVPVRSSPDAPSTAPTSAAVIL